jgi:hypothetical protein
MEHSHLWKILNKRSGDIWELKLKGEIFPISVPRLLPQETIDAIRIQAEANKTYRRGFIKHKYMLSSMIFCDTCSQPMFGHTHYKTKRRYYRHARDRKVDCRAVNYVRADDVENAVIVKLFGMFGDAKNIERAMERAIPNMEKIQKLKGEKPTLEKQLAKTQKERDRLVAAIAKGIITEEEASKQLTGIRERKVFQTEEIERIERELANVPSDKMMKRKAQLFKRQMESLYGYYRRYRRFLKMSFEEKQELCRRAFDGKDAEGKRLGVYIKTGGQNFTIRGLLWESEGQLPMSLGEAQEILGVELEYQEPDPFKRVKEDFSGICHNQSSSSNSEK